MTDTPASAEARRTWERHDVWLAREIWRVWAITVWRRDVAQQKIREWQAAEGKSVDRG